MESKSDGAMGRDAPSDASRSVVENSSRSGSTGSDTEKLGTAAVGADAGLGSAGGSNAGSATRLGSTLARLKESQHRIQSIA